MPGAPIPPSNVTVGGPNHTLHHQQIHAKLAELDARGSLLQGAVFVTSDQTPPTGAIDGDWWLYPTGAGPEGVIASFTASVFGATVSVNAGASQGTISAYSWDWGDGTAAGTGATATHTYAAAGTYTVKLTVSGASGASDFTTVVLPAIYAVDLFDRSVTGGTGGSRSWGSANIGGAWSLESNPSNSSDNSVGVSSDKGNAIINTAGTEVRLNLSSVSVLDFNMLAKIELAALPTASSAQITLSGRRVDDSNYYQTMVLISTTQVTIELGSVKSGTFAAIGSTVDRTTAFGGLPTAGGQFWIRFSVVGGALYTRIWKDGTTEPTTWSHQGTDTGTVIGSAGGVGIKTRAGGTYTVLPQTTRFDHLQVLGV